MFRKNIAVVSCLVALPLSLITVSTAEAGTGPASTGAGTMAATGAATDCGRITPRLQGEEFPGRAEGRQHLAPHETRNAIRVQWQR